MNSSRIIRVLGLLGGLALALTTGVGCSDSSDTAISSVIGSADGRDAVIRVGVAHSMPPYAFVDEAGRPRGLAVDLTLAIAEIQALEVELVPGDLPELRSALEAGTIDVIPHAPSSVALEERFALSLPHTDVDDALFVRADDSPRALAPGAALRDWLSARDLIVLEDDPSWDFASVFLGGTDRVETTPADALRSLAAGEGNCALLPARTGVLLARQLGLHHIRILPTTIETYSRGLGFAVRQGDRELLERFEEGTVILTETGRYLEIYNRWAEWSGDEPRLGRFLALLLAPILGLLLLSSAWTWQLRREVARRTAELRREAEERQRAELALAASEATYRSLFDSSLDAIALYDAEGRFVDANPACLELLGHDLETLRTMTCFDEALVDWSPEETELLNRRLARDGASGEFEKEIVRADGTSVPVSARTWRVKDERRDTVAYWSILHDLTTVRRDEDERKRLQQQIQQAQKLESLGVLAGGVAHDFNNLLMGILGHTALALHQVPEDSAVADRLRDVRSTGQRAAELCKQMLAYSGRSRMEVDEIDLSALIHSMNDLLAASIDGEHVDLELELADDLPALVGDRAQLRQIVLNLVNNAADALDGEPGVVRVRTLARSCDATFLAANYLGEELRPGLYVLLEVSDTGVGMSEDTLARIFEPFFSTKFTGRGLGLAATLGIVRGHHGAVQVETQEGLGTTVRVILPPAHAVNGRSEAARSATMVSGGI
ncbi:MAG: transporter substrate-binding domain-containing protein [Acidobacteriota bacterium]